MSNNLKYQKGKWYHVQEDGSLKNFRSMLKSNIKNFENIIEPTIEEMIDEDKAEELLPLIEHEIKVRSNDGRN